MADKDYEVLCDNVRSSLSTIQGRAVVWHILGMCDIYTDAFTGDNRMSYIEGKRSVGLGILQLLEDTDPKLYANMLLENIEDKNAT